jgi:cellulose synthase/poly-beta-1,6-N-acetylglucosamine synthase-like glycosyltransferase
MLLSALHIALLLGIAGLVLLLVTVRPDEHRWVRLGLCLAVVTAILLYLDWHTGLLIAARPDEIRGAGWVWGFYVFECAAFSEFGVMLLQLMWLTDRTPEADRYERLWRARDPATLPAVDAWVATYNEERSILERTIIGLKQLDWPKDKLTIFVLDDGRREWLRELCAVHGVKYVTRPDHRDRKAGNHNYALTVSTAPFIVSMDADFVPFPHFIYRTIGFFRDPTVAVVQTPQCFYNAEPMRKNLGLVQYLPDEQDFFYRIIQPGRDAWGAAFYCGSAAIIRRQAMLDIGGFVTATDIEDQATAVKLLSQGYQTRYLNEQLSVGLAPESNAALHDQRNRWCRGSLQILFMPFGPFGRGLRLIHRLLFVQSHWVMSGLSPLMYVLCPILLLWCDWNIFPNARPLEVFCIPLVVSLIVMAAMLWLARRQYIPFLWHGLQLFMAFELLPQALASLLKPFGKPLLQINPVTPKGTAARGRHIDVRPLAGLVVLMLGLITGLVRAGHDERFGGHPLEMVMLLVWSGYFMSIITIAGLMCFEPWYRRRGERFDLAEEPASLWVCGQAMPVRIVNMSVTGALIRTPHPLVLPVDQPMHLQKRHIPVPLPCTLVHLSDTELAVDFLPIANPAVRQAFVQALYTNPVIQANQQATFAIWPVVKRLGRLFVAWP